LPVRAPKIADEREVVEQVGVLKVRDPSRAREDVERLGAQRLVDLAAGIPSSASLTGSITRSAPNTSVVAGTVQIRTVPASELNPVPDDVGDRADQRAPTDTVNRSGRTPHASAATKRSATSRRSAIGRSRRTSSRSRMTSTPQRRKQVVVATVDRRSPLRGHGAASLGARV